MTQPQGSIPAGLISRDVLAQMDGIKSIRTSLLPSNSGGDFSYQPSGNSRVIFQIPSYSNSYISTRRSYVQFTLKTTGTHASTAIIADGAPVFNRMLLKNGYGQVLEDIDSYDVLCRIKQNMKPKADIQSRASTCKDNRVVKTDLKSHKESPYNIGKTVIHNLESGLLSKEQKFLIPVSQLAASSGHCFQLELWLNDAKKLFPVNSDIAGGAVSYQLTDVSYEIELVECDASIMQVVNNALQNGASIPLPFKSYRGHTTQIASGNKALVNISDSSHDVSAIYSILRKQAAGNDIKNGGTDSADDHFDRRFATSFDPYSFLGGKSKLAAGEVVEEPLHAVERYNFRYGSKLYPLQPVSMPKDSVLALENILSGFELEHKLPYLSETIVVKDNAMVSRFETDCFMMANNFKTTNDSLSNGINSSANGSPLQLDLMFKGTVVNIECLSFVESNSVLYISTGGSSSVIKN